MGSAPIVGRQKNRPGIQAAVPAGPLAECPLPDPEPGAGGSASGAGRPVPPCQGLGPGLPGGAGGPPVRQGVRPVGQRRPDGRRRTGSGISKRGIGDRGNRGTVCRERDGPPGDQGAAGAGCVPAMLPSALSAGGGGAGDGGAASCGRRRARRRRNVGLARKRRLERRLAGSHRAVGRRIGTPERGVHDRRNNAGTGTGGVHHRWATTGVHDGRDHTGAGTPGSAAGTAGSAARRREGGVAPGAGDGAETAGSEAGGRDQWRAVRASGTGAAARSPAARCRLVGSAGATATSGRRQAPRAAGTAPAAQRARRGRIGRPRETWAPSRAGTGRSSASVQSAAATAPGVVGRPGRRARVIRLCGRAGERQPRGAGDGGQERRGAGGGGCGPRGRALLLDPCAHPRSRKTRRLPTG